MKIMIVFMFIEPGGEYRAGRADARRTTSPRPLDGRKWGDPFYALGYMVEALNPRRNQ